MKGFMSQFASGSVGKNLQEGLGTLANKAQGLAQGLAQGIPKNVTSGSTGEPSRERSAVLNSGHPVEAQLQLQEPYSADEESAILRQQVVQLQVKNGMLQAELEEARGFAEEAAHLRALVSDMEVKMVFLLKGAGGVQPMLPKVLETQQKRIEDLTSALAEINGQATGLRADNVRLRCQVEDLMSKMASSARHVETVHNEQMREMKSQLAEAQEEAQQLREAAAEQRTADGAQGEEAATLREQLQRAQDTIKELEAEVSALRTAAGQAHAGSARGGANTSEALEWRIAELEEQLEEANDKLQIAERKLGPTGLSDVATLEMEVQKLRTEVESERGKVATVAAEAAAEATLQGEAALRQLQKRVVELEKGEQALAAARDTAEKRAVELETLQAKYSRALDDVQAATAASTSAARAEEVAVAALQAQLDAVRARGEGLESELEAVQEQCGTLQQQLSEAAARAAAAEAVVVQEREKVVAAMAEAAEARSCATALGTQVSEAQHQAAAALQREREVRADLLVCQRKMETSTIRIVEFTEREDRADKSIRAFEAMEAEHKALQEAVIALQAENAQLQTALGMAQDQIAAAREMAEQNHAQAELANDNVGKLRAHMDKIMERKIALEKQVQELQDQLPRLRVELRPNSVAAQLAEIGQAATVATATDGMSELIQVARSIPASCQTDAPLAAHVSTNTESVPGPDFSVDPEMVGLVIAGELKDQKRQRSEALAKLEEQLEAIEAQQDDLELQIKEHGVEVAQLRPPVRSPLPAAVSDAGASGGGWEEEDWGSWDANESSPRPSALSTKAAYGLKAEGEEQNTSGASPAPGGKAMRTADVTYANLADATVSEGVLQTTPAEARLAAYAAELTLLQETVRQLLGCWSGSAVAQTPDSACLNDTIGGSNLSSSAIGAGTGGVAHEATVLGGTVVTLLGQLERHALEAASMRLQLEEAAEELGRLRAHVAAKARPGSGSDGGAIEDADEGQGGAELEDMESMMQGYAAAEQRALAAEAAIAAATSLRRQLEQQLQHSDEAAAAAEEKTRQLAAELAQAKAAVERAAEISKELECCRTELADAQAALEVSIAGGAAKMETMESALVEAQACARAADARAAEASAVATAAEARLTEREVQLVEMERALSAGVATAPPPAAFPSAVTAEHVNLIHDIASAAQALASLVYAFKTSQNNADELSHTVSDIEALVTKLRIAAAAASAAGGLAPPSYEQSFQSKHIGPAAATLLAAEAGAAGSASEIEDPISTKGRGGAGHVPDDLPKALARNLSAGRRSSDGASGRLRLEAADAFARKAESELHVQINLAESLRAELQELHDAMEALREATVPKERVAVMEASYMGKIEQLQGYLSKAADKQARQIAAFDEEHSQALAAEQAQRATAVAAAAKAAEDRVVGLEAQLELARRAGAAAEERAGAAEAAAEEAKRLAQDIERGWGERLERLQKINKKRAAELDEARAESIGLSERLAAMGEQVTALQAELTEVQRQLESERASGRELRAKMNSLQEAGSSIGQEVAELRTRAAAAEAQVAELEQRASSAESKLLASEADRSKLADQFVVLHSLREERAAALAALAEAREGLAGVDALRARCEAAESARDRAALELGRVTAMMSNLEARLQQVEDENEGLVAELDEERRRGAALARTWAGELEALPSLPRDRWPAAVRRLVDGLEWRASHGAEGSCRVSENGHGNAEDTTAAELQALREAAKAAAERTARVEAVAAAANAALDALRRQMDEARVRAEAEARAESARRLEELDILRGQLSERGDALEQELHAAREQLKAAETGTLHLQEELQRLRDKSRALLEEKELEADALRAQLRQARAAAAGSIGDIQQQLQQPQSGQAELLASPFGTSLQPQDSADAASLVALRARITALEHELGEYKHAYEDAESTHQLRDTAQAALRDELARLRAQLNLSNQDVQYLRAAIISFFESGSLPRDGLVLQVLSRLLRFTPAEMAAIAAADHSHRGGRRGSGMSGTSPASMVAPPHTGPAAALGSSGLGLLASVTSRVASAVSGLAQPNQTPAGLMPQSSFGQRFT